MADRIKLLIQKRTLLKSQITSLTNLVERDRYDKAALRLRMARLTDLYHAYEEFNDELVLLDPNDTHKDEFTNVQERFYSLASKVEEIINFTVSTAITGATNSASPPSGAAITAKTTSKIAGDGFTEF